VRLYIHWPFCISRCTYCDFNTRVAGNRVVRDYYRAMLSEMDNRSLSLEHGSRMLKSVYLGGGTPSTMKGGEAASLLAEVAKRFAIPDDAEVTIEVNPATWSFSDFNAARYGGFNRFSIGVQSLDDGILHLLGRRHDSVQARFAVLNAARCGAASVSVDLIYGIPGIDEKAIVRCLEEALELGPHHVSLYALTLSPGTALYRELFAAGIWPPDEDAVADQYITAVNSLRKAGFERYEISNFCREGHHSRHNLSYWTREEFMGVGAGAHSYLGKCRLSNIPSVLGYTRSISAEGMAIAECEPLTPHEEMEEEVMLGLRTSRGVPERLLVDRRDRLDELQKEGLLVRGKGRVSLTTRGMLLSNAVIASLLAA
jgi:oxygen-independent coproporphyrinogen-3 oxidase